MTGQLNLVSVGPGAPELIPPLACTALEESDVIVGYELYLRWIAPWIAGKEIHSPPLTQERARAELALSLARAGRRVALVSSGDIGVYAMATLAFEQMREDDDFDVRVVPGITSANACASLLGAPLSHDFATLSLSDLLCPWEWIEQRARHIAKADLAAVFYNVQSQGRQEGVYRILRIMLEHKRPGTPCGIVRNAYRPDRSVAICTLEELLERRFDMLTTLVIGNRHTKRRRGWIYTPRGYHDWGEADAPPRGAVWVYSGTRDGNELAEEIAARCGPVVLSAATDYGARLARESCPRAHVIAGRRGRAARRRQLEECAARAIVDATHPYAVEISQQLMSLADELALPYVRFERPSTLEPESAHACADVESAARCAIALGRRIFLATGSKDLAAFLAAPGARDRDWFARVAPDPDSLQRAHELGLPAARILAMQGPFSRSFNEALWRDWRIDCVVTKDSGDAGGFGDKCAAARALGIPLVVVARPSLAYPRVAADVGGVLAALRGCAAEETR